jgi:hypothetical protein
MLKAPIHPTLFGAYVYDDDFNPTAHLLRFRVFTVALDAEAWARRKAAKKPIPRMWQVVEYRAR